MSLDDIEVTFVEDLDSAQRFLSWLGERRPVLAIDTETTGLQWWTEHFLRLVQFGDATQGWAISLRDWRGVITRAMRGVADMQSPVVMHNAPFDMHALDADSLPLPEWHRVHDTKIMDHLLDPLRGHGLKPMCDRLFGPRASAGQAMLRSTMSKNGWTWATVPEEHPHYWAYAALDTCLTAMAAEHLWPEVNADPNLRAAYEREMQTQVIMWRAEKRGMRVDVDYTARLREEWQVEAETLKAELNALGVSNPSSNRQLDTALRTVGWEPEEFTPTGAAKIDKVILQQLSESVGAEIAPRILRYKRLVKWTSAYLDHFLGTLDADGRIHCSVNTMAAKTGRMSITSPALQTLPRGPEIRDCIIPDEGSRLLAVDYDGMEFRVLAHYAQEPAMQQAIRDGINPHNWTAAMAYGIPLEDVTKEQYDVSKNTGYGKAYGAGAKQIAKTAGITELEAQAFIAAYDAAMPGVVAFMRQVEQLGRDRLMREGRPYVTTWGGRAMVAPEDKLYKLVNGLIQGGCADLFKQKIIDLDAAGFGDYILLPVHDEIIFDVPEHEWSAVVPEVCRVMAAETEFDVPLTVAPSAPLTRWGDKYAKGREIPEISSVAAA